MGTKTNCWDILHCGREVNGANTHELGVCPASTDTSADGLNGGKNGGRICWAVSGTFCGGERQGTFAQKKVTCMSCEVYKTVRSEEKLNEFRLMKPDQQYHAA
jgi:hypothetical protein